MKKYFVIPIILIGLLYLLFVVGSITQLLPCRSWYGKSLSTGKLSNGELEFSNNYMKMLNVRACIVNVNNEKDILYARASKRFKIGFFNKWGWLYTYPARIGGLTYDGGDIGISLCGVKEQSTKCTFVNPEVALSKLTKSTVVEMMLVIEDKAPWAGAQQTQNHADFFNSLKTAISKQTNFPVRLKNNDFVIQVIQVAIGD